MHKITACLDLSSIAASVNKAAIWLSQITGLPLSLLHTIEHIARHEKNDLSGYIGLGDSVKLLQEITRLDEKKNKLNDCFYYSNKLQLLKIFEKMFKKLFGPDSRREF